MLVLQRRLYESVRIGPDITVTVVRVGDTVSLGIDAPKTVAIARTELLSPRGAEDRKAHDA
jgi:carbon storage regulator